MDIGFWMYILLFCFCQNESLFIKSKEMYMSSYIAIQVLNVTVGYTF